MAFLSSWWIWRGIQGFPNPRFYSILISVNDEPRNILPGEIVSLHPDDEIRILKIYTNILINFGVRLSAMDIDVNALQYENVRLSTLLSDQGVFDSHKFIIRVKHYNHDLGYVIWKVQPYGEDWLSKADSIADPHERLALLERSLRVLPEDERVWRRLVDEYKAQRLWKRAASMLEEKAGKNPEQDILIEILEIYTSISSKDRIISVLKRLIKLDPGDVNLRGRLAEALEERGKKKEAIKEYKTLLKQLNKSDSLSVKVRLAYLYTETGQFKNAISYYLKAVELDRKDANLYYNLSYLYEKIGQKEKGESYLAKAVALKTEDIGSRLKLARNLINKKKFKEAEKYLLEILDKKPKSIDTLILIAELREKQGEKQKLKDVYKKILALDPKNDTVLYNIGILEYETGNLKASLPYFKKYLERYPKDRTIHEIVFDIYKRGKNYSAAFEEVKILLMLDPTDISLYNFAFTHLNAKGDYSGIIKIMEKGVKADPKRMELREYLVFAFLKTGKEAQAIDQIKEILKARPNDIELIIHLAGLYEKQGNISGATEAYKKVLDISPTHKEAGEAYLRLRLMGVKGS